MFPSATAPNSDPIIQDDGCLLVSAFTARARATRHRLLPSLAVIDNVDDDQGSTTLGAAARSKAQASMT